MTTICVTTSAWRYQYFHIDDLSPIMSNNITKYNDIVLLCYSIMFVFYHVGTEDESITNVTATHTKLQIQPHSEHMNVTNYTLTTEIIVN